MVSRQLETSKQHHRKLTWHSTGISVGKLDLYVAAGGFHPSRVMPVVVDVGTDNETLLNEPLYMGLKQKRMRGRKFVELMDEIVTALTQRYPKAVLQFEDFAIDRAKPLLERYRYDHLVFNDDIQVPFSSSPFSFVRCFSHESSCSSNSMHDIKDIRDTACRCVVQEHRMLHCVSYRAHDLLSFFLQGTACSALAGVYGALSVQNLEPSAITKQRIVMVGALLHPCLSCASRRGLHCSCHTHGSRHYRTMNSISHIVAC
jgi:hypothetical protein